MTKDKAALKLALEFIERVNKDGWILADFEPQMYEAITAIKEALAPTSTQCEVQPEQEPVAFSCLRCVTPKKCAVHGCSPNTWPSEYSPKRPWVGLTDVKRDEILDIYLTAEGRARAIEAELKELNT